MLEKENSSPIDNAAKSLAKNPPKNTENTPAVGPLFAPFSPDFARDPYAVYAALRQAGRPLYDPATKMWMLSCYDDVSAISLNPDMVRSLAGLETDDVLRAAKVEANFHDMPYHERFVQCNLLDSDGEGHRRLRALIFNQFTGRSVAGLEPFIQDYVDRLIHGIAAGEDFDFIADFAAHIPGRVIVHLLGAPAHDAPLLCQWSDHVVRYFDIDRTDGLKAAAETAAREFHDYLTALKASRHKAPKDDLISKMLADEADGKYKGDEFISTCMLILMAGHGSSIDMLGSGMHLLLKFPEALSRLRQERALMPSAIQEMFRYESPLPFFHRHAAKDVRLGGRVFEKGTTFGLLYGAANRDPKHFENPDIFDIGRAPNRHLAFGRGAHLCLGNHLARLNMSVVYGALLDRFDTFALADADVRYKPGLSVRGPIALHMRWS